MTPDAPLSWTTVASPLGALLLVGDRDGLEVVQFEGSRRPIAVDPGWGEDRAPFAAAIEQLDEYFAGERRRFELALAPAGTAWQRQVWAQLAELPYGEAIDYGELAARAGRPSAARAAGGANARNPLAIVVPCHRVIGGAGTLTGYAGGVERKRWLLGFERGIRDGRRYELIGADGRPFESATPGTLGGHRKSRVYGRLDCAGARSWIRRGHYVEHRVFFPDEPTAVAAGYRPCGACMRERYTEWKALRT